MKILSIDHGTENLGFAISDDNASIARALKVMRIPRKSSDVETAMVIISEERPSKILVGMPLGIEGKPTAQSKVVKNFINKLTQLTVAELIEWNESFSSTQADILICSKKTGQTDSEAARIILQEYLDFINTGI